MKKLLLLSTAIFALAFAGCSTATKTDNSKPADAAAKPEASAAKPAEASAENPIAVMTLFVESIRKKDAAGIRSALSKSSIEMMEKSAKDQNKSLEEMLAEQEDMSKEKLPEIKNEMIDGDSATIEVENEITKKWDKVPFIKEDGKWKLALDKLGEMKP